MNGNGITFKVLTIVLSVTFVLVGVIFGLVRSSQADTDNRQDERTNANEANVKELQKLRAKDSLNIYRICEALKVKGCEP